MIHLLAALVFAGAAGAEPPRFSNVRYDEDYSYLSGGRSSAWERLKFIPLAAGKQAYLSIGGEVRDRYEYFSAVNWGAGPRDSNGYGMHRFMLHSDLHAGPWLRAFGQIKSGMIHGREGGSRPTDEDRLDLNQAFVDVGDLDRELYARPGRQELSYGSSRLISNREGPNVHLTYDAIRVVGRALSWRLDGFAARPVETNPGLFDDHRVTGRSLWGIYGARRPTFDGGLGIDLYYLGYGNDSARFDAGLDNERRHTAGTRLWSKGTPWDYNFEIVYQWGRFGSGLIRAWTIASDSGYSAKGLTGEPRFGLRAGATSGDRDPTDARLETFNPLFPKGSYFGESALIGPYNHIDAHPEVEWQLPKDISLTVECDFFWRYSTRDGIYNPAGTLIRTGQRSRARYVGAQPGVQAEWRASRFLTLTAVYTRFFAGEFLRQTPPASDIDYVTTWATLKF